MKSQKTKSDVAAGLVLIASASLSVFAMLHHPSSGHSHGAGGLNLLVHATMLVLLVAMFFGFAHFAIRRGLDNGLVLAGLIGYSIHVLAHLIAATTNGFIVPALSASENHSVSHDIFVLCREINQVSAKLGIVAAGFAFCLWGLTFLLKSGIGNRLTGALGILCAILPAAFLARSGYVLDVPTAIWVYTAHAVWTIAVGIHILKSGATER